jgi:hypothetical protein
MTERQSDGIGRAAQELRIEVSWCSQCRADVTVQIVQLATDPEPVALCVECGAGVAIWLSAEMVDPPASARRPSIDGPSIDRPGTGGRGTDARRAGRQGAA